MSHHRAHWFRLLLPLMLFLLGCPPPAPQPPPPELFIGETADDSATGLRILGTTAHLAPASQGTMLVQVHAPYGHEPQPNANVKVTLSAPGEETHELFTGQSDEAGLIQVNFDVPATISNPNQTLTIVADTAQYGQLQISRNVYVGSVYNVLLSTDKPLYQPGQTIHLRTLALDTTAVKAAQEQPLVLTVSDPAGNKLMRKALVTSDFGIASTDFQLDTQAASGDYILTAEMGPITSRRSVEVKPYTLPRFAVTFQSDASFYLPGAMVTGTVDAQYFFGKPVAGGQVRIKGFVTDVDRFQVFELTGTTDADGFYAYEFQVPDYFVGQLANNTAQVELEITVIDMANHSESMNEAITVAEKPILIEAIPESGFLRPGLENILYLQTSYPDGQAAPTALTIAGVTTDTLIVQTDAFGLATITVTVPGNTELEVEIDAVDSEGQSATQTVVLTAVDSAQAVLLRPEKVAYQIGETLNIDILVAGKATTVYLDVIKGQQTFGLAALPVIQTGSQGIAQAAITLDGTLLGTLELNAYVITQQGEIVRDRRLILVNPAPATVAIQTDAEVYRPGDTATLDITVAHEGMPMSGVIGLSIVDESVFAVGTQDPGFARTYFLLDRELQAPRYEIHDFTPLEETDPSVYDQPQASSGSAQQIALAGFFAEELQTMGNTQPPQAISYDSQLGEPSATLWGWANRIALVAPLLGVAFYNGTRRRRQLFLGLVLLSLAFFWTSCASAMPASQEAAVGEAESPAQSVADATTATQGSGSQPPRLRQFFPETLFWLPELTTDTNGHVQVVVPIADSITTWRISVLVSDQDGNLGSAETGLRVFQDFFVEPDLPRFLTVGDTLSVPVSIFNYLETPQEIELAITPGHWFELMETADLRFTVAANEVMAVYIPIRVTDFGLHDFQITASGSAIRDQQSGSVLPRTADSVLRQVEVLPEGRAMAESQSGKLAKTQHFTVAVPDNAVPGTARVTVKVYPGIISQVIDGLEGMLQQPYGCFEQTSSTTYPNILVLDYLKSTGQASPRVQLQAEQYINLGYQRLLNFEVNGMPGGFSLFGEPPPQTMLTAYGLMEFTDMRAVSYVDPLLIERTANFLFGRQQSDGSWMPEGMTIESGLENLGNDALLPTAYVTWALADAGYANSEPVQRAVGYLQNQLPGYFSTVGQPAQANSPLATPQVMAQATAQVAAQAQIDPYVAAMVVNALIAAAPEGAVEQIDWLVTQLLDSAQYTTGDYISWHSNMNTYMGGSDKVSNLESAAMTAIALLRLGQHPDVAQGAINYIISQRDANGMFYNTQTTVLALKALLAAAKQGGQDEPASVTVTLNGERTQTIEVTAENADVVQFMHFDDINTQQTGENTITIAVENASGQAPALQYQLVTEYYLPWQAAVTQPTTDQAVRIDVAYDRSELQVNDVVAVNAEVEVIAPGIVGTLLVDLGIPPGFTPLTDDLDGLVTQGTIARYEVTGRQILIYMTDVPEGQIYTLTYRLQARFPLQAQTPSSRIYDYYTPAKQDTATPQRIIVKLGTPGQ